MSVNEPDMDDWAALWAEEPSCEEQVELHAIAKRVTLREAVFQYADFALAVLLAAGVLVALAIRPAPATIAVGLIAALGVLWYSWKQHELKRQIVALLETRKRADLLDLEIKRAQTALTRSTLGLWGTPPAIILFAALTYGIWNGGSFDGFGDMLIRSAMEVPAGPAIVAAMLTLTFQQLQIVQRLSRELQRLQMLSREYQHEASLDRAELG